MPKTRSAPPEWADTPNTIKSRQTMDVTLMSQNRLTLRTVHMDEITVEEGIPGDLIAVAILDAADLLLPTQLQEIRAGKPEEAQKLSLHAMELRDRICARAILKPEPTEALLASLDQFDKQMVTELAQRKRSTDATGKVVAAESLGDFAQFREVGDGAEGGAAGGADGALAGAVG